MDGACTFLFDSQPFRAPQGLAVVLAGGTRKYVVPETRVEEEPQAVSLRLLEMNALINGAFALSDCIELPCLLGFEGSENVLRLYDMIAVSGRMTVLPPDTLEISLHVTAAQLICVLLATVSQSHCHNCNSQDTHKLVELKRYLLANIEHKVSAPEMAKQVGMSRSGFCKWMWRTLQSTPARYSKQLRLEKCLELIVQGDLDLAVIAERTGFADRYHLGREFKRYFGLTPARCRLMSSMEKQANHLARSMERFRQGQVESALDPP